MERYLVKEGCGVHVVYDQGELERHLKMGWTDRPEDWLEQKNAAFKAKRAEEIKAELARLEEPEEKKKPGRPKKGE